MRTGSQRCGEWAIALKRISEFWNNLHSRVGIRTQLILHLLAYVAFVIALLWVFEIVLLGSFYRIYKTRQIRYAARAVADNIGNEELDALADRLSEECEVCILLLDEKQETILTSEGRRNCLIHHMRPNELREACAQMP